jgi:hypothetical protein
VKVDCMVTLNVVRNTLSVSPFEFFLSTLVTASRFLSSSVAGSRALPSRPINSTT